MASWLKAAEDLFEVVDRRAKQVATEIADDAQPTVSNGPATQRQRRLSKPKHQKNVPKDESSGVSIDTNHSDTISDIGSVKTRIANAVASEAVATEASSTEMSSDPNFIVQKDIPDVPFSEPLQLEQTKQSTDGGVSHIETSIISSDGKLLNEKAAAVSEELVGSSVNETPDDDVHIPESESKIMSKGTEVSLKNEEEKSGLEETGLTVNASTPSKMAPPVIYSAIGESSPEETKADLQDQLEEAQALLKTTNSSSQSKEARLAKICTGLSNRLQEYKSENAQLEELLAAERELSKSYESRINQLQQNLSLSKGEVTRVESSMLDALSAKNSEIEALVTSLETFKKKASVAEGSMAAMQANLESIMRNRELTETRMMQALREELSSAERRAEDERAAHNATKMAAREREAELEHRAVEASTALAKIQRMADERTTKAAELEQKVALLEVECASLNQELQDMETHVRRGQKKSLDESNQASQIQAWQEEVERARQGQRDAENKLSFLEAEVQKMRVEISAMKRDSEHYSRQEHIELEKRYRELTDLLYLKQTQLESMASEKAALEFQLEKEVKRLKETQNEVERSKVSRRPSWDEETEMKTLETLPLYQRHMLGAGVQLQKAAKMLDTGAARATRFLWRYPTARLILLFYLVFVHLFLMYLLHRLQVQADEFSNYRDNSTLP